MDTRVVDGYFAMEKDSDCTARDDSKKPSPQTAPPSRVVPHGASHRTARMRRRIGLIWLFACLSLAAYVAVKAMPGSTSREQASRPLKGITVSERVAPLSQGLHGSRASAPPSKPIEHVQIFDRVAGTNPLLAGQASNVLDPDPTAWRVLSIRMKKESGKLLHIKLARPQSWVERMSASVGRTLYLELPEMGAVGHAEILGIKPCPALKAGSGNVVTGTFAHEADDSLVTVTFNPGAARVDVTDNHPFWSEDRQDFVAAGELRKGERVRGRRGSVAVSETSRRPVAPSEMVYNLEVHGAHVYEVTKAGLLVHNSCLDDLLKPGGKKIGNAASSKRIRILKGGKKEAEDFFLELATRGGGKDVSPKGFAGMLVELKDGGKIGFRPTSKSGPPTIDVSIPGIGIDEIKFIP